MIRQAVNWNKKEDDFTLMFWEQNFTQIWSEEEISVSNDLNVWEGLSPQERETFGKVLAGLTLLDTEQGGEGMPLLELHTKGLQRKSVLGIMGFMEHVHAKSYSHIFTTLLSNEEIDKLFAWVQNSSTLQKKANTIGHFYDQLIKKNVSKKELYMGYVASCFLESYLFYSGFFFPLYLAGQGKMTSSGEVINLIIRDESIHAIFVGLLAQELYQELSVEEKREVDSLTEKLLVELYENELLYTKELYTDLGLEEEVASYVRYNANRALMNIGKEPFFPIEPINPVVENGLKTDTKNHDFFSLKGSGYVKQVNIEQLSDDDFIF